MEQERLRLQQKAVDLLTSLESEDLAIVILSDGKGGVYCVTKNTKKGRQEEIVDGLTELMVGRKIISNSIQLAAKLADEMDAMARQDEKLMKEYYAEFDNTFNKQ